MPPARQMLCTRASSGARLSPATRLARRHATRCSKPTPASGEGVSVPRNVLGGELLCCCSDVRNTGIGTGFYRDGFCSTGADDEGRHTVCVEATAEFLQFSAAAGNPLHVPMPEYLFPGVAPGDRWCLCAARWAQALRAGKAPKLFLRSCHEKTLEYATLEQLKAHALDLDEAEADVQRVQDLREALQRSVDIE